MTAAGRVAASTTSTAGTRTCSTTAAATGSRVVNAGSVGAPYAAEPAAYWALLGRDIELRRTEYDLDAAAAAIAATGYPAVDGFLTYLQADPERPARSSALIEGLPWPPTAREGA